MTRRYLEAKALTKESGHKRRIVMAELEGFAFLRAALQKAGFGGNVTVQIDLRPEDLMLDSGFSSSPWP